MRLEVAWISCLSSGKLNMALGFVVVSMVLEDDDNMRTIKKTYCCGIIGWAGVNFVHVRVCKENVLLLTLGHFEWLIDNQ